MREGLRDYARMAWRHKPVRYSYLMLGAIGVAESARQVFDLEWKDGWVATEMLYGAAALGTLALLRGGWGTFKKYRRTRDQLREEGEISDSLILHYHKGSVYCGRVGIELAAEDCGYDEIPKPTTEMIQRSLNGMLEEVLGDLQDNLRNMTMEDIERMGVPEDEREEAYAFFQSLGEASVGEPRTFESAEEFGDYIRGQGSFESFDAEFETAMVELDSELYTLLDERLAEADDMYDPFAAAVDRATQEDRIELAPGVELITRKTQ